MLHPETIFVAVEQAWLEPGSLKSCDGHHLEPQGSRAYSSSVLRVNLSSPHSNAPTVPSALLGAFLRRPLGILLAAFLGTFLSTITSTLHATLVGALLPRHQCCSGTPHLLAP